MLQIIPNSSPLDSPRMSRRELLRVTGAAGLGLSLPALLQAESYAGQVRRTAATAKNCIYLFMWGGPAHQDMWDLKPDAPASIRGEFHPIATNVPGVQIGELLPLTAQQADKYCIVRSMTHERATFTTPRSITH